MYLQEFTENQICEKCGNKDIAIRYCPGNSFSCVKGGCSCPNGEHIACHCRRCHYEWLMKVLGD